MLIKRNKTHSEKYEELYTDDGRHHATVLDDGSVMQHVSFHEQMGTSTESIIKNKHRTANRVDLDVQLAGIKDDINTDEY